MKYISEKIYLGHKGSRNGSLLVETMLAGALLALVVLAVLSAFVYGEEGARAAGDYNRATFLADEGLEAVRNMRDGSFANLTDGFHGLAISGGIWTFSGTGDLTDNLFLRVVSIGTVNVNEKQVTSTVGWVVRSGRLGTVTFSTRLTNWAALSGRGGMLVYGDGGTASDTIRYRILSSSTQIWGSPALAADVDAGSTNKALRAAQVYSSPTRNEKVLISRHYNGSNQFIYAQVWNGTTTSWGNVTLLSSWAAGTFLDVQNFSGTYLANGNFMVVYSDNSTIPKARIWDGATWQAQTSLTNLGASQIPNYIVAKARLGTNEVMAAFFTQGSDAITEYYNGSTWSAITSHSTAAPVNTKRFIDFAWSPSNALIGGLIYANGGSSRVLTIKIWTANGSGGGSWSGAVSTANQGAGGTRLGALAIVGRPGASEFVACDANTVPQIICYSSNFTPVWTNPTNPIIAPTTDAGIERTFDVAFEAATGNTGLGVYSDATNVAKLKKYNAPGVSWDAVATSLNTLGGTLKTVRLVASPISDDVMILLGDASLGFSSVVWDGTNNVTYTSPTGYAFAAQGTNGSAAEDYWFDFVWDQF